MRLQPVPTLRLPSVWVALALFVPPGAAWGNAGPPGSGGHLIGEPHVITDVAITRESLAIDLRPLAANGLAQVEVIYQLINSGAEKKLDLLFAAGASGVADFRVWLDDGPVAASPAPAAKRPADWRAPDKTPGLHGKPDLDYLRHGRRDSPPVAFALTLSPGPHVLKVRYEAEAATHSAGGPAVYRQFGYVLAPARAWAGFGGLDVTVHLPPGWHAASRPALERDGDSLKGNFPDLPADSIVLTVQAPAGRAYRFVKYGSLGLLGVAVLGGAVLAWWGGRARGLRLARQAESDPYGSRGHAWPISLGLAAAWGSAILLTGLLAIFGPVLTLPAGQGNLEIYSAYFALLGLICLSAVVMPVGFMIAQVMALVTARPAPR